jgi:tetratricopeptide (TPR) repeat protein
MGRHDKSIIEAERAQELDPLSPGINHNLGLILYSARQYNRAIEEYKNLLEIAPDFEIAYNFLGLAYAGMGMYDTALVQVQRAIELSGKQSPLYFGTLGFIYASMGNRVKAVEILDYLLELAQHRYIAPLSLAIIYGALDLKDQAFEYMENGYEVLISVSRIWLNG